MEFMEYRGSTQSVFIPTTKPQGTIAATISGGADSALLLHLLLTHNIVPTTVVSFRTGNYLDSTIDTNPRIQTVIGYLEKRHNVRINRSTIDRAAAHHSLIPDVMALGRQYDFVFSAVTALPPKEANVGGTIPGRPEYDPNINHWKKFMTPFQNVDKRTIREIYEELNLQDLWNATHSCTTLTIRPCNECFACQERNWSEVPREVTKDVLPDV